MLKLTKQYAARKKLEMSGAIAFNSPIRITATAMIKVKMYPRTGSLFLPKPFPNQPIFGYSLSLHSAWNTFGADTKLARADERVAAKHPA